LLADSCLLLEALYIYVLPTTNKHLSAAQKFNTLELFLLRREKLSPLRRKYFSSVEQENLLRTPVKSVCVLCIRAAFIYNVGCTNAHAHTIRLEQFRLSFSLKKQRRCFAFSTPMFCQNNAVVFTFLRRLPVICVLIIL